MKTKSVEIIASGYEWVCPYRIRIFDPVTHLFVKWEKCEHLNKEIEVTEKVQCSKCGQTSRVGDYHHAIG
jgi:hypothetical protein